MRDAWLILADTRGVGDALAAALSARGARCLRVRAGDSLQRLAPDLWTLDPARPEDFDAILAATEWRRGAALSGIAHLWSLDVAPVVAGGTLPEGVDLRTSGAALQVIQAMARAKSLSSRLVLVTEGAQPGVGRHRVQPPLDFGAL